MKTEVLAIDLKEEAWFRDHLSPTFGYRWERAVSAVEQPDWRHIDRIDSADLALCLYLAALMPEDIEPRSFLEQVKREGVPYCEANGFSILDYLEHVICFQGYCSRVIHIDISSEGCEAVCLSEDPEQRDIQFTLDFLSPNHQSMFTITRIPQAVLRRLAEFVEYGVPNSKRVNT